MKIRQCDIYPHSDAIEFRLRIVVEKASNGFLIRGSGNITEEDFKGGHAGYSIPLQKVANNERELISKMAEAVKEWSDSLLVESLMYFKKENGTPT